METLMKLLALLFDNLFELLHNPTFSMVLLNIGILILVGVIAIGLNNPLALFGLLYLQAVPLSQPVYADATGEGIDEEEPSIGFTAKLK